MPRSARVVLPDVPLHVTQRGVDRCPTFLSADDFAFYLCALREASTESRCRIHAYVLMTNHVHLLLTPAGTAAPARMMRSLGRRYVRYFNARYQRTGTLWEGRFRSTVVGSTAYLFACSRYIEMNPVRAGMVAEPADYVWSSFHSNAVGEDDPIVTPHPEHAALGDCRELQCGAYRALFASELSASAVAAIRTAQRAPAGLEPTPYRVAVQALTDRDGVVTPPAHDVTTVPRRAMSTVEARPFGTHRWFPDEYRLALQSV